MSTTLNRIREVTGGTWELQPQEGDRTIARITDDSRKVSEGDVFFALRGAYSDGHEHIPDAVHSGAQLVVAEESLAEQYQSEIGNKQAYLLVVEDSLKAFHAVARDYRLRASNLSWVIGITGSNGKTSVKEMIAAALERQWPGQVLKTSGNTNNHFGVPRNLLRLTSETRAAVLELGCNQRGEIAVLADIVCPDIGVITNIGQAHIENFGDQERIAREKAELLARLPENGVAVIPYEDAYKNILHECSRAERTLTFGTTNEADLQVNYRGHSIAGYQVELIDNCSDQSVEFTWHVPGFYQAVNACTSAAAAKGAGLSAETAVAGLRECTLPSMRLEIARAGEVNWVNDAYNANPESMRAGVECFLEVTGQTPRDERRFLVLGDMLELGEQSYREHVNILKWARQLPDCYVIALGEQMTDAAQDVGGIVSFAEVKEACTHLKCQVRPNDWVFLKGSRKMRLEDLMTEIAFYSSDCLGKYS